jgi:hypothetical protein
MVKEVSFVVHPARTSEITSFLPVLLIYKEHMFSNTIKYVQ